ncbi:MAG: phosphoribosylamine--glycine ligase [Saprospiraceae bacterium]|nr:phosphoribosylamine--glycine ligase [Saprospiraceae bacterium]MBP7679750.1 phosphoribosylamine--glycine ligase [Saprospiraceae bacterium]
MSNILLIGAGGREHALAWKLKQSPLCQQLFIAPGNAGTAKVGQNIAIQPENFEAIRQVCIQHDISLVVVGPEAPLVAGICDYFRQDTALKNIAIIAPSQQGAMLEGSKAFAKSFMQNYQIPTAKYAEFTANQLTEALVYVENHPLPVVLKADGLAAGKGVIICQTHYEAQAELRLMLSGKFGEAGKRVVIEEFLTGIEFSVFVLTDGKSYQLLPEAKDYKRVGEGDTGLNTGGMGAVSPVPFVDAELMKKVDARIIQPTLRGIQEKGFDYTGFIFFGLINVQGDPYVIEYNCRLGDPETEVIIPRIQNDLVDVFIQTAQGNLSNVNINVSEQATVSVMLVAGGYPEDYRKGDIIEWLTDIDDSLIFHAGTTITGGQIVTNGGRVLAVTALANTMQDALYIALKNAEQIHFEGKYFRRDIGKDMV